MLGNNNVVLFCSDSIYAMGLIRALGEAGKRIECVCYGSDYKYLFSSRYVIKGIYLDIYEAVQYLLDNYRECDNKPILFTIPDTPALLVNNQQEEFAKRFLIMKAGKRGRIGELMSKSYQSKLANQFGFKTPYMVEIGKKEPIPSNLKYPVFTKSIRSFDGGKQDEMICRNESELSIALWKTKADKLLVMQFLNKRYELNYLGISVFRGGKVYVDYHDKKTRFPKEAFGHYQTFHRVERNDFYNRLISMIQATGYEGLFDVEFIQDVNDDIYFMEINFRTDGEVYKLLPGINLPGEWCKLVSLENDQLPQELPIHKEKFTGMTEVDDFRYSVLIDKMNPFIWFWQFIKADKHMLINLRDPMPFIVWFKTIFFK